MGTSTFELIDEAHRHSVAIVAMLSVAGVVISTVAVGIYQWRAVRERTLVTQLTSELAEKGYTADDIVAILKEARLTDHATEPNPAKESPDRAP